MSDSLMEVIAAELMYSDTLHHAISSVLQDIHWFTTLNLEDVDLAMVTTSDHTAPVFSEHYGLGFSC